MVLFSEKGVRYGHKNTVEAANQMNYLKDMKSNLQTPDHDEDIWPLMRYF